MQLILVMKNQSLLRKGCCGYLAYVLGNDNDAKLDDILIVQDYPDVFPKDLPRLLVEQAVEFTIELVSGTTPISKAPYHMTHLELKELKPQL